MISRTLPVELTPERIRRGEPGHPRHCPLGLAVAAAYDDAELVEVSVSQGAAHVHLADRFVAWRLPRDASDWTRRYDDGEAVEPASYRLELLCDCDSHAPPPGW